MTQDIYLLKPEPSERAIKGIYSKMAKELLEYWEQQGIILVYKSIPPIQKRLRCLIEIDKLTIEQIKLAIKNYSISAWHIENKMWKQPLSFLNKALIMQWQAPRSDLKPKSEAPYQRMATNDEMHAMVRNLIKTNIKRNGYV